jgi:hypothetical protein
MKATEEPYEAKRDALVRLAVSDHEKLKRIAKEEGRSLSGQIRFFIKQSLSRYAQRVRA